MTRPRILVTCWRRPLPTYLGERTILDTLDPAYAARIADAGGLPLVVSRPSGDLLDDVLALADGLLLTGGGDVDPASYGKGLENADEPDTGADDWELALIAAARERGLPTLGICRGAQLLAVAHGGRLIQRLPDVEGHDDLGGLAPEAILSTRHQLEVTAIAPGGVIEAVEPRSDWACVGVQWHPEKMHEPSQLGLFAQLVSAARARSGVSA
jgi:putative glutamine amidotransferase